MSNYMSGIYKITNTCNGKFYIGSSVNFTIRKSEHFRDLRNNKHPNRHLQKAFNKYGEESFKFEVIEYVEDKNNLLEREQYWIDRLNVCDRNIGYNIAKVAGKPPSRKGIKLSAEHKNKISETNKKMSKEIRNKISKSQLGENNNLYGKTHSAKTKDKIRNSLKGHIVSEKQRMKLYKPVINLSTNEVFNSIKDASNSCSISETVIVRACKGKQKTAGGYRWIYREIA